MELSNEFRVAVSVPEAWKLLTDLERIAPMLPGAQLQEVEGEEYRGVVKVKVGPITAQYKGQATFVERDEDAGRVVLKATGRDTRGQGNASAVITATMTPDGDETKVTVVTDLTITGKVAQFGRGVLAEVSAKLLGQFVDALHADLAGGGAAAAEPAAAVADNGAGAAVAAAEADTEVPAAEAPAAEEPAPDEPQVRRISAPEAEPVDLIAVAGGSTMKRMGPVIGVVAVILIVLARRRARRARQRPRGLAQLTANLPSMGEFTGHLPSVGELTGHLPSVGELTGHLPDLPDLAEVRSAVRRHQRRR